MENENNEIKETEVVENETVNEVVDETPTEEPVVEDTPTEAPVEKEEDKGEDSSLDTTFSENPSEENSNEETENTNENSDDTPPSDEEKGEEAEGGTEVDSDEVEEVVEEPTVDVEEPEETELERVQRELAELKDQEESRKLYETMNNEIVKAANEFDRYADGLQKALIDTFKQYGIDTETTLDELKNSDPAKYAIATDLLAHAEHLRNQEMQRLQAPVIEAQKNVVFREASKVMSNYDLTEDEAKEAAMTLINIFNNTGLADLDKDLKAKVELAVARAKMIVPKVEKVVEEVKEIVEDTKEAVKDVITEEAPTEEKPVEEKVEESVAEEPSEEPTEAPTEAPKADLGEFMESAVTGDAIVNNREGVTVDNVLRKLSSLPYKARTAFYKEYADLIKEAGIRNYKNQGLR